MASNVMLNINNSDQINNYLSDLNKVWLSIFLGLLSAYVLFIIIAPLIALTIFIIQSFGTGLGVIETLVASYLLAITFIMGAIILPITSLPYILPGYILASLILLHVYIFLPISSKFKVFIYILCFFLINQFIFLDLEQISEKQIVRTGFSCGITIAGLFALLFFNSFRKKR